MSRRAGWALLRAFGYGRDEDVLRKLLGFAPYGNGQIWHFGAKIG